MRKFFYLLLAVCLPVLLPTSLYAWDVCETSVETLDLAGEVTFTSSFCNCVDGMGQTNEITDRNVTESKARRMGQSGTPDHCRKNA